MQIKDHSHEVEGYFWFTFLLLAIHLIPETFVRQQTFFFSALRSMSEIRNGFNCGYVSVTAFDCDCLCQMKTDGQGVLSGSGPGSRGAAPGANVFIYSELSDRRIPADLGLKWSGQGRLWEQSPVSGWPCCSPQHKMQYLLLIYRVGPGHEMIVICVAIDAYSISTEIAFDGAFRREFSQIPLWFSSVLNLC